MQGKDFVYNSIEVECSDLKIVFITDERTAIAGQTDVHMHSFWELFALREGSLTLNSEQSSLKLEKNQILIIPPNMYHSTDFSEDAVKESVFFTFCKVKSADAEKLFDGMESAFGGASIQKFEDCEDICTAVKNISEHNGGCFASKWRVKADVTKLMFALYDKLCGDTVAENNGIGRQSGYWVYKYAIDRILDLYYMNDISLEFLSEKLFLSPQNVTRIISAAYGKSFNELKLELKMRNAKKMLSETNLSVTEISRKTGYTSERGFLNAFRKYEGCTPREYRKKKLQN